MTCAQSKDTDEPWHLPILISLRCLHEEPCTFSYPLSAQSSLGAQVILLFLSCNSSYDCHIIRPTLKLFLFPFTNKIQKLSSFKSNEKIHKREDGSYYVVLANKASSVTL